MIMIAGLHDSKHRWVVPTLVHHAAGLWNILRQPVRRSSVPGATWEQQGTAPGLPVCVSDGELRAPADELQILPHGSCATYHEVDVMCIGNNCLVIFVAIWIHLFQIK